MREHRGSDDFYGRGWRSCPKLEPKLGILGYDHRVRGFVLDNVPRHRACGDARYIWPGPLRPGKFRFCALITTWSGRVDTPGPALMHAPQLGSITRAPACSKISI